MYLVLDANAIISEGYGRSSLFRFLLYSSNAVDHHIAVPKLVVEEVVGRYLGTLKRETRQARRAVETLSRRLTNPGALVFAVPDVGSETASIRHELKTHLEEAHCVFLNSPEVAHDDLISRAVRRKKPFDDKGSGYRDTLIWLSILELANEVDELIVFVSADKAFSDNESILHEPLIDELVASGNDRDAVQVVKTLNDYFDTYVVPQLGKIVGDDPLEALAQLGIDLADVMAAQVMETYSQEEIMPDQLGLPWEYETLYINVVEEVSELEVFDVREITKGEILLRVRSNVNCDFDAFVFKSDVLEVPDLVIHDPDWNNHYVWGGVSTELECVLDLRADVSDPKRPELHALSVSLSPSDGYG